MLNMQSRQLHKLHSAQERCIQSLACEISAMSSITERSGFSHDFLNNCENVTVCKSHIHVCTGCITTTATEPVDTEHL